VGFAHRGQQWADRVAGRRAVRYDISYDPAKGRWYLDASWKQDVIAKPPLDRGVADRTGAGVDLNADHLACCMLDASGNPLGLPVTIRYARGSARIATGMGGSGRRSPPCSTAAPNRTARRW